MVSGGADHSLALRSDGHVVGFGYDRCGETSAPPLSAACTYVAVAAGGGYSLALRSDGHVVGFGRTCAAWTITGMKGGVTSIAVGTSHSLLIAASSISATITSDLRSEISRTYVDHPEVRSR
ncbi:hypothetical protein [Rhodococcus jostii]